MSKWNQIIAKINSADDIVILTHTNMDGDAIGSSLALCLALKKLGKRAIILLEDKIPDYLNVILNDRVDCFSMSMPFDPKLAIVVDCGSESRIEKRLSAYQAADYHICIDHHQSNSNFADLSVVEPACAATGILIYELLQEMGDVIDKEIAEDLYAAIITDTGSFKYSNTTAYVHEVIGKLYGYGIDHVKICTSIYDNRPLSQLKAESLAIDNAELFSNGKAVVSFITLEDMSKLDISYEMVETCIDRIRVINGTEIAAFAKEKEPNVIKVSFRSKTYADVNSIASRLGGGGHKMAAGCTLLMSMDEAIKVIKNEIIKEING